LLTIYALGATPDAITKAYQGNANYQRSSVPLEKEIVQKMHDPEIYASCMGDEKYYHDYLVFYTSELESKGLAKTLDAYLFGDTKQAFDLFGRLFAGLLHPLIHLGFGLEFDQPAIVAEALAQAAVHENWISPLFVAAEEEAKKYDGDGKTLDEVMEQLKGDDAVRAIVQWDDDNKTRDGVMKRGMEVVPKIVAQWQVKEDQLQEKTAEMISNVCEYLYLIQREESTNVLQCIMPPLHRIQIKKSSLTS
jgi:Questin oxidase-like